LEWPPTTTVSCIYIHVIYISILIIYAFCAFRVSSSMHFRSIFNIFNWHLENTWFYVCMYVELQDISYFLQFIQHWNQSNPIRYWLIFQTSKNRGLDQNSFMIPIQSNTQKLWAIGDRIKMSPNTRDWDWIALRDPSSLINQDWNGDQSDPNTRYRGSFQTDPS
jgi:hypothetical protein